MNRVFVENENKELEQKANRISKLNGLLSKFTQNALQIKKECREGNYELDRTYDTRTKSGRNAGFGHRDRAETSASPEMAQTPLEAVT